jgi:mannosyl-oligosaccharide glucosidase
MLRFGKIFSPSAPFRDSRYYAFSQSLFSNLAGGIGYFYGNSKVDNTRQDEYREDVPEFWKLREKAHARGPVEIVGSKELFTTVPSRAFFPRGFLWDEGFHLLIIMDWDIDLAMEIIKSWLALMDDSGWIAREQILGPEARSKVPKEFQTQYPHYANPPTMFMAFDAFLDILDGKTAYEGADSKYLQDNTTAMALVEDIYPKLKKHYNWFRYSQKGNITNTEVPESLREGYRWRGRTPQHTLTSGLDDYPRAQPPHPSELHVDAISWVGMMAMTLHKTASYIGGVDAARDVITFATNFNYIRGALESIHWSDEAQAYCDITVSSGVRQFVCHKGYVSLMPFLAGTEHPTSAHLPAILNLISDPKHLWTPHGIRSLSLQDEFHGKDENYWRGPIWLNMNYLVLIRLYALADYSPRARKMYISLRENIVNTVYNSWQDTGFAWEQYNEETGAGQRTQGFTGWTALVVKIMHMPDLSNGPPSQVPGRYLASRIEAWSDPSGLTSIAIVIVVLGSAVVGRRRIMAVAKSLFGRCLPK